MTEAQKCLYHIAENMRMAKSISKEGYEYFQQAIKALEQEPKILNTLDFAIDASNGGGNYFVGFRNGLRYAKSLIDGEEEPQFESCTEQEPCTDVISRQAAIDCLNADFTIDGKENMETVVDYINGAFKQIKALSSITPQQRVGKWIEQDSIKEPLYGWYFCSECNSVIGVKTKFCSNCGAIMEEKE